MHVDSSVVAHIGVDAGAKICRICVRMVGPLAWWASVLVSLHKILGTHYASME